MKKVTKAIVSTVLASSMMFGMTSCSLFDKAGKQCKEVGDQFMEALIERDAEDMAELCTDDDEALALFERYCGDQEALEAVIEAVNGTDERLIYEGSDMFYHLIVLLTSKGLRIEQLAKELQERHDPNWKKH